MTRSAKVHRIAVSGPDDVSGLAERIVDGTIDPAGIVAIFGKTEGNGLVNDFSRGFAVAALTQELERHLSADDARAVCLVMSGGTEGGLAPHWLVLERGVGVSGAPAALAIGRAHTPALPPEALGRLAQVDQVAEAVRAAIQDAGIAEISDVHFVQVKCPLLTAPRITEAAVRGHSVVTRDTLKSMGLSRAASALGVGVALGEIDRSALTAEMIGSDLSVWSDRASCSAGIELTNHEVVVLGMSAAWSGPLAIDHAVMRDGIDIEPVRAALARLCLSTPGQLGDAARPRLAALLAKAEASQDGRLRGRRHTMLDDSDISSTRHARAFVAGALGGLVGHAELFVSGGAEHQGPSGGGPVALIVARGSG